MDGNGNSRSPLVGVLVCFNCPKVLTPASLLCYFYKWEKASGNPLVFIISFFVPKKKQVTPIRLPKNEDCLGIMIGNCFVFVLSSLFVCCKGEIARKWLTRGLGGARHRECPLVGGHRGFAPGPEVAETDHGCKKGKCQYTTTVLPTVVQKYQQFYQNTHKMY